mgnify:CR=1 FL=1
MDGGESDSESECPGQRSANVPPQGTLAAVPGKQGESGQTILAVETFRQNIQERGRGLERKESMTSRIYTPMDTDKFDSRTVSPDQEENLTEE